VKRILVSTLVAACFPFLSFSATHYTAVTTTATEGGHSNTFKVESWVDGAHARVVFKGSTAAAGIPEGRYIVTNDGAQTLYMVNPDERSYSRWDINAMLQSAGAAMNAMGGMVNMQVENQHIESATPAPGPEIHGLSTTHYVFDTTYDLVVKVFGMKHRQHVESHEELWTTTELKGTGFAAWLGKHPPKTGNKALDDLVATAFHNVGGMVLKQLTKTTTTDKKGRAQVNTQKMEVTSIEEVKVDPSIFSVPEGYREVPPEAAVAGMQQEEQQDKNEHPSLKSILGAF